MREIIRFKDKYHLTLNKQIVLLAQINHVIEVMGKKRSNYMVDILVVMENIFD